MRFAALLLALMMTSPLPAAELPLPVKSRQAVVVIAPSWSASTATLQRWARDSSAGRWEPVGKAVPVMIGERGLGWGLGLHRAASDEGPRKAEGDRRAPAGVFALTGAFGKVGRATGRLPWQQVSPTLEAVDDPKSRYYNRIVDRARIEAPDWRSSERMAAIPDYALGIVVAHNPRHLPGAGSCIFIHLWLGPRAGTAGCTILREADLLELLRWLDPASDPVLVQLPHAVAARDLRGF
jgi:L,D-peptidoglycan transpeptidase YkuD (ErfK/YbiS/YcfS/YnhG family)